MRLSRTLFQFHHIVLTDRYGFQPLFVSYAWINFHRHRHHHLVASKSIEFLSLFLTCIHQKSFCPFCGADVNFDLCCSHTAVCLHCCSVWCLWCNCNYILIVFSCFFAVDMIYHSSFGRSLSSVSIPVTVQ